jgi:hypothetical protein
VKILKKIIYSFLVLLGIVIVVPISIVFYFKVLAPKVYVSEEDYSKYFDEDSDTSVHAEKIIDGKLYIYKNPKFFPANIKYDKRWFTVNGKISYKLEQDSLGSWEKTYVYKDKYHQEFFWVGINNDTLSKNESLIGRIFIRKLPGYKTNVVFNLVNGDTTIRQSQSIKLMPMKSGLNILKGKVYVNNDEYPFEYKYWVKE